ncbi:synaptopodin-like isoform X2 [Paramacrobiotus metropolitanus]|uniref:synaptopodin-like isoform X2 n=1 Tax=Paramacrobiotus metropolitanus TaxID=2943436 RepID=UPI002445C665|nr:synaptopodin-like isoform X2 [Paramacrobiotus metropolitanus]
MSSGVTRKTPRGAWVSPATGSPLHSPFSKITSPGYHYTSTWDTPRTSRNIFGGGWSTLKEAIKEGAFSPGRIKQHLGMGGSSQVIADVPSDGLWTELHRGAPVKTQIPHEKEQVDKLFGMHVGIWFAIGEAFAKGGFGEVRYGYHKSMSAKRFAVKIESVGHTGMRHLSAEYNIYSILGDAPGIPRCYYYGLCGTAHNALVMDLLGPSLDDIFEQMKRKFTLRCVCLIALQCFERLQYMHNKGVVHGDVKGENFLTGLPNEGMDNVIYIVDFGLSQVLKDQGKGVFLYNENSIVCPSGTPRYMSVSAHNGNALSYRDDLESLAYVLVYFLKGRLPWQGIHEKDTSKKSAIIKARKAEEAAESICSNCPDEFAQLLRYSRALKFYEEPDYVYLKQLFRDLLTRTQAQEQAQALAHAKAVAAAQAQAGTQNLAETTTDNTSSISKDSGNHSAAGEVISQIGEIPEEGGAPSELKVTVETGFDWVGKNLKIRKEPTRHPILPRAEFQKKVSVPSLQLEPAQSPVPQQVQSSRDNRLLNAQRKSAHQLTINSNRSPSNSRFAQPPPIRHSPSVPHVFVNSQPGPETKVTDTGLSPSHGNSAPKHSGASSRTANQQLKVPLAQSVKSAESALSISVTLSTRSDAQQRSPRITRNSIELSLSDDDSDDATPSSSPSHGQPKIDINKTPLKIPRVGAVVPHPSQQPQLKLNNNHSVPPPSGTGTERTRKVSVFNHPTTTSLLKPGDSTGSLSSQEDILTVNNQSSMISLNLSTFPKSPLTRSVSQPVPRPAAYHSPSESEIDTDRQPAPKVTELPGKQSDRSLSKKAEQKSASPVRDQKTDLPSGKTPVVLSGKENSPAPVTRQPLSSRHDVTTATTPKSANGTASPQATARSRSSSPNKGVKLARAGLRYGSGDAGKPETPRADNVTASTTGLKQRSNAATGSASVLKNAMINNPSAGANKTLHRINPIADVQVDEEPMILPSATCFAWLKRRTRCGGNNKRSSRISADNSAPLVHSKQPFSALPMRGTIPSASIVTTSTIATNKLQPVNGLVEKNPTLPNTPLSTRVASSRGTSAHRSAKTKVG